MSENSNQNIAVLIDGDNAQACYLEHIISEISKYGRISIKRIYGDFSSSYMNSWKEQLNVYSIKPVQKFAHASGKNATDIALVIDAMDILYSQKVDGFCIVSSDSDFTSLTTRIKESGLFVMGIGKKMTPKPFINACDVFVFTENFDKNVESPNNKSNKTEKDLEQRKLIKFLHKAYAMVEQDSTNAYLQQISQMIRKLDPSFDTRTYGYKNYRTMFEKLPKEFDVVVHQDGSTISIVDKKDKNTNLNTK